MARRKNATFQGVPLPDAARDSSIFKRTVDNIAGDFALVFDKITGENGHSATDTINHSGNGRGAPLRLPLANQQINRSLLLKGGVEQDYIILAVPVYVPAGGPASHRVLVSCSAGKSDTFTCEVRDTSWALIGDTVTMRTSAMPSSAARDCVVADIDLSLGNWQFVIVKRKLYLSTNEDEFSLNSWHIFTPMNSFLRNNRGVLYDVSSATSTGYPSKTSLNPGSASSDAIDAISLANDYPLDAYVLTRLNRMIGVTWEYLTGSSIPGNASITCATTVQNNQSSFTAEPSLAFPIFSNAYSAIPEEEAVGSGGAGVKDWLNTYGTTSPNDGPIGFVRYPQIEPNGSANAITIASCRIYLPSFNNTSSTLNGYILLNAYTGTSSLSTWRFLFNVNGVNSTAVAPVQIGTTRMWYVAISAVPFSQGTVQTVNINCYYNTGAHTPIQDKLVIVGAGLSYT